MEGEGAESRRCERNVDLLGGLVHADLDTLVTALYVTIDDRFGPRHGPGRKPKLTDAELICLAVAQVLLGVDSERRWLRYAGQRLDHLFPYLPTPSAYNRRLRRAAALVALALQDLATRAPSWWDQLRLVDSTPVPCAASRQTVKRSALAGVAGYGYCKRHHRYFWGLRLYVLATPDGLPVAWCLATPKLGEREVVAALLAHERRRLRPGLVIVADKGFAGHDFEQLVAGYGAVLVRPDRADEPYRHGSLGRWRQWIESTFDTLKDQLSLERHRGRTLAGVYVRVAQRLLALAAAIWWNWQLCLPDKRSLVAYDH
jgi:Transposase DDE domain